MSRAIVEKSSTGVTTTTSHCVSSSRANVFELTWRQSLPSPQLPKLPSKVKCCSRNSSGELQLPNRSSKAREVLLMTLFSESTALMMPRPVLDDSAIRSPSWSGNLLDTCSTTNTAEFSVVRSTEFANVDARSSSSALWQMSFKIGSVMSDATTPSKQE